MFSLPIPTAHGGRSDRDTGQWTWHEEGVMDMRQIGKEQGNQNLILGESRENELF